VPQCNLAIAAEHTGTTPEDWYDVPSRAAAQALGFASKSTVNDLRNAHKAGACKCHAEVHKVHTDTHNRRDQLELGPDGGNLTYHTTDPEPIRDWDDILTHLGADPERWTVASDTVRVSRWQQSSKEGGERDLVWLTAYKAEIRPKATELDLPALYAEVARNTHYTATKGTAPRTTVVAWADIQTGKVDRNGNTLDLLQRLEEKRTALTKYLSRNDSEHIIIADVGDIVEGFDNVSSQIRTNDLSLMDQVDIAATELWKTIRLCAAHATVDVLGIPSNHAQWRSGKGLAGKPNDDWGIHISKRLEHLANETGLPVRFHRPADEFSETLTYNVRGTLLGLAHGHQATNPDKVTTWWGKMSHAGVMDCDVLLTGHYHHLRVQPSGRSPRTGKSRWHLQAPTLDNGSAWVNNTMGEDGDPGLLVFGINDDGFDLASLAVL